MSKEFELAKDMALAHTASLKPKCDKCGDPNIYKSWDGTKLCQICYEDLAAEAALLTEELENEEA